MDNTERPTIIPPKFVFEDDGLFLASDSTNPNENPEDELKRPVCIGVEFPETGGLLLHFDHCKYPQRGWPYKDAIRSIDAVKRAIISVVNFIVQLPKNILKGKVIDSAVFYFTSFSDMIFNNFGTYWKEQYLSTMVRELWRVGMDMAHTHETKDWHDLHYGDHSATYDEVKYQLLVKAICHIFEFDNFYRYALQEIFSLIEIDDVMKNPSKELYRVLKIVASRGKGTEQKFSSFASLLWLMLKIPSLKKETREFFKRADMSKLYPDEIDQYTMLIWSSHDFGGRTFSDRRIIRANIDAEWMKEGEKHFDTKGDVIVIPEQEEEKNES